MMEEEWRDIEGYKCLYQVSNMGKVKSLNYKRTCKEKILKTGKNKNGYLRVILCKNNKHKKFLVHRLVATAFIDNPENKPNIDHINTIKDDNRAENLRWCTQKENIYNPISRKRFLDNSPIAGKFGKDHYRSKKLLQFTKEGVFIREWDCAMDVKRDLGFNNSHISACCSGKRKTAYNYKWKYA